MSSYGIARSTCIGSDTVLLRIRKLRESRVITRMSVVCNLASFGYHWYTVALQFSRFTQADEQRMREFLANHPHVTQAERTYGPWDAILEIIADASSFHQAVKDIRKAFSEFTRKYETWVAYREHTYVPMPACVSDQSIDS
jgi:DNA-binding Lrp family transcriptional regulator